MPATASSVTIRPVEGRRDRQRFVDVPYDFYPDRYPQWVPPLRRDVKETLDPAENAFFDPVRAAQCPRLACSHLPQPRG